MSKFTDSLYNAIAYLGSFPFKLIVLLFKGLLNLIKALFKRRKTDKEQLKRTIKKYRTVTVAIVLTASVIIACVALISKISNKVSAIEVKMNDEVIGYANNTNDVEFATSYAQRILGSQTKLDIKTDDARTEANNIKSSSALSDIIINKTETKLIPVYEIYLSDKLLGVVTDVTQARKTVAETYELTKKLYPDSAVSFSQGITFVPTLYAEKNIDISTIQQFKENLGAELSFIHAKCEETVATKQFDTVEVQTNALFVGDSRVRREGENGQEYKVSLVKYLDNQKIMSEHLLSYPISEPVTKIVERGIRAQSLTMDSYTVYQTSGMFCWPVVDLYTVTSPYGPRRLGNHKGIDISGGNASGKLIVAAAAGTIIAAGWNNGGYGNYVVIRHGNGVETLYAHMLDNSIMVNVGDYVQRGQTIGRVGNTGNSFGAHLHFEVRINGNQYNPAPYLGLQ